MSLGSAIVDKLLTNESQAIVPEGFVCEEILTPVKVPQDSGKIGFYGKDHLRIENDLVDPEGRYNSISANTRSTQTYQLEEHGLKKVITRADYKNYEKPYDAEKDAMMQLVTKIYLGKEKALADTLTNTAVLTNNVTLSGTAQWNDYTNSDPLGDIDTGVASIEGKVGVKPNIAIMSSAVRRALGRHPKIIASLGYAYNRAGRLTDAEIAEAIGVEKILVAKAVYNSAKKGQTDVIAPVWGKHFILAVVKPTPSLLGVTLGYQFTSVGESSRTVFNNPQTEPPQSKLIQVRDVYDLLVSTTDAGYLIKNAIA